ncbi:MAG: signal peptidase I [Acholeplasmatales bacterium]|nr:signal peptidase I [Acholeplasmatales bacterium]
MNEENNKINKYKMTYKDLVKNTMYLLLYLVMFIFTLIYKKRIDGFNNLFGSFLGYQNIGILLYYITLVFGMLFYVFMFSVYWIYKNDDKIIKPIKIIDKILDIPSFIVKCISIILFIMIFITTPCTVLGDSMNPTFESNNKVLSWNVFDDLNRDDIVVFNAKNYNNDNNFYIKRVVAASGDIIKFDTLKNEFSVNGILEVGVNLSQFKYITGLSDYLDLYEFTIPKDKVLVFGDNRDNSEDSRSFGLVDESDVFGIVYFSLIPFGKI